MGCPQLRPFTANGCTARTCDRHQHIGCCKGTLCGVLCWGVQTRGGLCRRCVVRWHTLHCLGSTPTLAPVDSHARAHPVFTEQGRGLAGTFSCHTSFHTKCVCPTCYVQDSWSQLTTLALIACICERPPQLFNVWALITAHGLFLL